jgi:flagellar hook-associated protein 2
MGTSISSLTSAASSTNGLTSSSSTSSSNSTSGSSTFTGSSAYSQDLQNVINRAVAIASLPVQLLTNQQTTLNNQSTELQTVDGLVGSLQAAVQGIQQAMSGSSYSAAVSDPSVVSATLANGAQEGVYPIQVESIGAYAAGTTASDWGTPANGATFSLVVGGTSHAISTSDTSATGVAAAINQQYGDMVHATVLNVGSGSTADTRISLQAVSLGPQTLDIQDSGGASLFSQAVAGSQAEYIIPNTGAAPVYTNSRSVEISPGVTLTMQAASPGNPVDVTVTRSTSVLATALSAFATAYNNVVDEITKQHGQNAGPLQGSTLLQTISQTLSQLSAYGAGSGAVNSLSSLGFDLGTDGHLTFSSFTLAGADILNSAAIDTFLGDGTTGGFLKAANDALTGLEDPTTGLIKNAESNLQTQITNLGNTITTKQNQLADLQMKLQNQMAAADALLSTLEQQYSVINQLFQAQQTADNLYK